MQKILFSAVGTNVFALALLKSALLFGIYALVYCAAREIFDREKPAVLASVSLLLVPNIVWESQRDQTHLILATACAATTLYIFIRLLKTGQPGCYAAFGALAGLGALSKLNYLFFPVSLMLAALSVPKLRPAVLSRKLALSLLAVALGADLERAARKNENHAASEIAASSIAARKAATPSAGIAGA